MVSPWVGLFHLSIRSNLCELQFESYTFVVSSKNANYYIDKRVQVKWLVLFGQRL